MSSTPVSSTATTKRADHANTLVDHAAASAEHAIQATQHAANSALDSLSDSVQDARKTATPIINRAADQAAALAQRGVDTVRESAQQVREKALRATDYTTSYIKDEPLKAVLIAAATGAALMALISLMSRSSSR